MAVIRIVLLASLLVAAFGLPRFRGSDAFVIADDDDEYGQQESTTAEFVETIGLPTTAIPLADNYENVETDNYENVEADNYENVETKSSPAAELLSRLLSNATVDVPQTISNSNVTTFSQSTETVAEDGHNPYEVVDAALDLLNTPMHRVVGSSPLKRLLRLVGPTREDLIAGIQMSQALQKASGQVVSQPPATLPPLVDNLFGFNVPDEQLFRSTTTVEPLFPLIPRHPDWKSALNKVIQPPKL